MCRLHHEKWFTIFFFIDNSLGLEAEGLFRISGNNIQINQIKEQVNEGKKIKLETLGNIHTITGLIKLYLRDLPKPMLTFEHYDALIAACGNDTLQNFLFLRNF